MSLLPGGATPWPLYSAPIKLFAGEDGPSLKINLVTIISSDGYDFRQNKTGFFFIFEIILATSARNITHDMTKGFYRKHGTVQTHSVFL